VRDVVPGQVKWEMRSGKKREECGIRQQAAGNIKLQNNFFIKFNAS
jgi:hypothetical protein